MNAEEKKVHRVLQQLATLKHHKDAKRKASAAKAREKYLALNKIEEDARADRKKAEMKELYRRQGKEAKKREFQAQGGGRFSKKMKRSVDVN